MRETSNQSNKMLYSTRLRHIILPLVFYRPDNELSNSIDHCFTRGRRSLYESTLVSEDWNFRWEYAAKSRFEKGTWKTEVRQYFPRPFFVPNESYTNNGWLSFCIRMLGRPLTWHASTKPEIFHRRLDSVLTLPLPVFTITITVQFTRITRFLQFW
jgi:hypothetical protein